MKCINEKINKVRSPQPLLTWRQGTPRSLSLSKEWAEASCCSVNSCRTEQNRTDAMANPGTAVGELYS
jgi:hypothetical protein